MRIKTLQVNADEVTRLLVGIRNVLAAEPRPCVKDAYVAVTQVQEILERELKRNGLSPVGISRYEIDEEEEVN